MRQNDYSICAIITINFKVRNVKDMKKHITLVFVLLLLVSGMIGCNSEESETGTDSIPTQDIKHEIESKEGAEQAEDGNMEQVGMVVNKRGEIDFSSNNSNKVSDNIPTAITHTSLNTIHEYILDVYLPDDYVESVKYPVVYVTDGNWRREDVDDLKSLYQDGEIQDVIYVLICYPDHINIDYQRFGEFINEPDIMLDIIVNGIVPYISDSYSVDKENATLCGASCGGYFLTYSFLQNDQMTKGIFKNYILASPTFEYSTYGTTLDDFENEFASRSKDLKANIYMSVGALEEEDIYIKPFENLVKKLSSRGYQSLNLTSLIDEGENHYTVWIPNLMEGLKMYYGK